MAKKLIVQFECIECGNVSQRWLGRCPQCNAWNSFKEVKEAAKPTQEAHDGRQTFSQSVRLNDVSTVEGLRYGSGISEFDRVLGGGWMTGSAVLLGGEPGIGKSTLMSHAAANLASETRPILYVNGEESQAQIKLRWIRLELDQNHIHILESGAVATIKEAINDLRPRLCIVDSVQTIFDQTIDSHPGSTQQTKFASFALIEHCKANNCTLVLIAHVTKEGIIAGPKMLEHMVDTVLYFEEAESDLRLLRATKNRFGATDELGIFKMSDQGLHEVLDLRLAFGQNRANNPPPGIINAAVYEGTRTLPIELQALTVPNKASLPRLYSEKIDHRRVSRISAILERHGGLQLSDQDLYVHIAGGLKINDPALDLSIAIALYSSKTARPVSKEVTLIGELTLAGEVRGLTALKKRIQAAFELGSTKVIGPVIADFKDPRYKMVSSIKEAIQSAFE